MKVFIESDDGTLIDAHEIRGISSSGNVLIFFSNRAISNEDKRAFQAEVKDATGKDALLIDGRILPQIYFVS